MLPCRGGLVARRKVLKNFNVGRQSHSRKNAFEEVMAQKGVLRHFSRQRRLKGIDVVDAFSGVRAFLKQILVDIGNRRRIWVDATRAGEDSL